MSLWGNLSIVRLLGILRDSWRAPEGEHLSLCRSSVRESWGGAPFLETWKNVERRAQTDITLHGGPTGEFGRRLVYQGLEKALEMGTFLHWGPFTRNSERWLKGGSGNGASLSVGAL